MHPAKSVIYFTTATGAGYGLFIWLALFGASGVIPADQIFGLVSFGIAFFLVVSGLLSSTLHLAHPERAWRALSQWRSSWLSREGVIAITTFLPLSLFAISWVLLGEVQGLARTIGALGAILCLGTVFCTAMIYASLKAIPAWNNVWVVPCYLIFALASGALLLSLLLAVFNLPGLGISLVVAVACLALGMLVKLICWSPQFATGTSSTSGTATGLGELGEVRLMEAPHTEANFLLKEMGFQIARKHARKLRRIAIVLGFVLPAIALGLALNIDGIAPLFWIIPAVLSHTIGIVTERWLFFAEAQHVVMLYYGQTEIGPEKTAKG